VTIVINIMSVILWALLNMIMNIWVLRKAGSLTRLVFNFIGERTVCYVR
jgi:hypothetical protein